MPVTDLLPLLRLAHEEGVLVAAESIAKSICSTSERSELVGDAWAVALRHLPSGDTRTGPAHRRCVKSILDLDLESTNHTVGLDCRSLFALLSKLPTDRYRESLSQTSELSLPNLNSLPAAGPWQQLEGGEWRGGKELAWVYCRSPDTVAASAR